jgi:predicted RecB family nuclease
MATGEHSTRLHALCSASGSERWIACPGSVGLSLKVPEPPTSPAAAEGTAAHELSEVILHEWLKRHMCIENDFPEFLKGLREKHDPEMFDYVMQYVEVCFDEVAQFGADPAVRIEQRLTFSEDMKMFGTADFLATGVVNGVSTGVIVDLKYGKGKKVKTTDNPQLAYYAVALKLTSKRKLERVKVKVVQPRMEHFSGEQWYTVEELDHWHLKLSMAAESALMMAGGAKTPAYKEGSWCWFCPGKSICPEAERRAQEKLIESFPDDF